MGSDLAVRWRSQECARIVTLTPSQHLSCRRRCPIRARVSKRIPKLQVQILALNSVFGRNRLHFHGRREGCQTQTEVDPNAAVAKLHRQCDERGLEPSKLDFPEFGKLQRSRFEMKLG